MPPMTAAELEDHIVVSRGFQQAHAFHAAAVDQPPADLNKDLAANIADFRASEAQQYITKEVVVVMAHVPSSEPAVGLSSQAGIGDGLAGGSILASWGVGPALPGVSGDASVNAALALAGVMRLAKERCVQCASQNRLVMLGSLAEYNAELAARNPPVAAVAV
jgi:hypothetical protein